MITLEELQNMWKEDCKVDELNLGQESTRIPELHSKYLNYLTTFRLQCRKAQSSLFNMRRLKWKYYRGELDQKELNKPDFKIELSESSVEGSSMLSFTAEFTSLIDLPNPEIILEWVGIPITLTFLLCKPFIA